VNALKATSVLRFDSLDSTNEEALRQLAAGSAPPLWIVAAEQGRGRGRSGRVWHSPKGNLYASLLLRLDIPASVATQLSFVTGLAAHEAIAAHLPPETCPSLRLKWPNDVMLDGAKIAGVLIESLATPTGKGLAIVAGIGINCTSAPEDTGRPVTSLGRDATPETVFPLLAAAMEHWLSIWNEGQGFGDIREAWLDRALAINEAISVHLNGGAIRGKFRGVDRTGGLQLETGPGVVITVNAGDIYPEAQGSS
jgi:BirA family transcriptional regulator, biotin operon repressor / biotin---[acetyl-CoA-carboxylase] ligase